ncbi:MAG: monovalent cation:proton antiporter-2 (CPA2) family protein [Betaproteobacteria bacterium]|nr:monovalent cation:proton antiporter-2 (CPA2) family protein [Betaproteobacteria bacterium]MDH5222644.1 monovalent cation:proton antiporter-2 (CPA2) family protein [Betaproteobacteria bacterium]MDH5351634.1 monovalent cation:proton antiporter-2 (CPA2) family protein [Betaproteobacteria bacterium]
MSEHGFLYQALIYLAAGVIAVPLFKRLGLGSVLGFLAAGMVIGPWGLKLVSRPEAVLHFAEIGVVLLLFLVGLELNPQRLWQMRRPIFGMGATQVVSTIVAVSVIGWALGQPWTIVVVAGMGFAMSSTAIALATLQERRLLATPGGQAGFSVLLFQDLAVIPLALLLALLSPGVSSNGMDWMAAGRAAVIIAALIAAGHFGLRPLLRVVAKTGQREIFIGFALLLVLGVAALMDSLGLSMALGAFLAGVMLAESEYRHELELDIEPFKGLLLGLFFIAVGMSIDLGLFVRAPLVILALALGIVALKIALLYPIARVFGYCAPSDALVFALGLSQVGEFAFVLFAAAGSILPRETYNVLNAVVAVSMVATPFLMILYARVLAPRLARGAERAADVVDESTPVVVAGFGRFGQVVTRVLNGLGMHATLIDHDPSQIELVRRFGSKAYYGDATRLDVLEKAGVAQARLLVVAIDDPEAALRLTREVRKRYPALKIISRAHGRSDAFEYHEMGVPAIREMFGSALDAAEAALRALDYGPMAARRVVTRFRRHDEEMLAEQAPHRGEMKRLIAMQQQGRSDLERLLRGEAEEAAREASGG